MSHYLRHSRPRAVSKATPAHFAAFDATQIVGPGAQAALEQQVQRWRSTITRWESEPEMREGRRELMNRARAAEATRDQAMHEDGRYDTAAALLPVEVVPASAGIITSTAALAWVAGVLRLSGTALSALTYAGLL